MKKILIGIICLVLCCTAAAAEEKVNLGAEGNDWIHYACTLQDGRLLFAGSRGKPGNYQESRARLLCLNPDRTVSWEYFDPATGCAHFSGAALLEDGTIGVIYSNAPYQSTEAIEIRKFTTDGVPAGEAVDIFRDGESGSMVDSITSAGLQMEVYTEDGEERRGFLDWNGELMFSFGRKENISPRQMFAAEGGLVLAGSEAGGARNAKIMKMDLSGKVIWETVLPMMMVNGVRSWTDRCVQTPDGGYLAWVIESDENSEHWAHALVRFDANGRVLWQNKESFDDAPLIGCSGLIEYQNLSVMLVRDDELNVKNPGVYRWFDTEGREIGQTELRIPREDAGAVSDRDVVSDIPMGMIIMEDGLWSLYDVRINDDNVLKEMDSVDAILYKVPEPAR